MPIPSRLQRARRAVPLWQLLVAAQSVVIGFVVTFLFRIAAELAPQALRPFALAGGVARWLAVGVVPAVLSISGALIAGCVVARLHRTHRRLAVWSYAGFVLLLGAPRGVSMVANAVGDDRYLPGLGSYALNLVVVVGAIAVGGGLVRDDRPATGRILTPDERGPATTGGEGR